MPYIAVPGIKLRLSFIGLNIWVKYASSSRGLSSVNLGLFSAIGTFTFVNNKVFYFFDNVYIIAKIGRHVDSV